MDKKNKIFLQLNEFPANTTSEMLLAADEYAHQNKRNIIYLDAGSIVDLDGSDELSKANHVIFVGDNVKINNARGQKVHETYLGKPCMFPPTVKLRHLKNFQKAAQAGTATVMIMGDSIGAVAMQPADSENYMFALIEELQIQNVGLKINFINAAIGGTTWRDMDSDEYRAPDWLDPLPAESWKACVARNKPDLLILHCNGNDVPFFNPFYVKNLLKYFEEQPKVPSIILAITHAPTSSIDTGHEWMKYHTQEWQHGLASANGWIRSFAKQSGYGYLDFDRWMLMRRDGVDNDEVALSLVEPNSNSSVPAWGQETESKEGNIWWFPEAVNVNGVSAHSCTDFAHAFSLSENPVQMILSLRDGRDPGQLLCVPNAIYISFNDPSGKMSITWSDGVVEDSKNKILTNILIPKAWPCEFNIIVKGARVWIRMLSSFSNCDSYNVGELVKYGTGYATLFDGIVTRFGGEWHPSYTFVVPNVKIKTHSLAVGSRVSTTNDVPRNMPDKICYDLYKMVGGNPSRIGGSNAYHMNAYGVRDILVPVVRHQEWGVTN
ncbi:SGNH/GDSL hydrolase family protein [Acetobacter sp. P5B1]|uniref:SGNH/GDSL hydrolase family protein n=1 Tax=Acetobacter sp. P5B1 TaxID=2762620 RepID=UPI001C051231|nr:SGNH/GDSL hydrolase family protein [Acetobacter sp. P5B1]